MKKILVLTILLSSLFVLTLVNSVFASSDHSHESKTKEGEKLVQEEVECDTLNDGQLETIGEYLMEQMHSGESHGVMHDMMGMKEGAQYHKQFHVNLAERMYCGGSEIMGMPMMQSNTSNGSESSRPGMMGSGMMSMMMGGGNVAASTASWIGWIFMILFWSIIILAIVALIKWIINQGKDGNNGKTAEEILKQRYAKGEIDKEEFEDKKKDLT